MKTATIAMLLLGATAPAFAQHSHEHPDSSRMIGAADAAMSGPMSDAARKHMEMSPPRPGTRQDTVRAMEVVKQLRTALAKYADTAAAVADGYKMFAPNLKQQRVFHFTNYKNAFLEAFRFDADKPTSVLYQRAPDGTLKLIGAMYTAPKRLGAGALDERVPLSIARWHKHVEMVRASTGQGGALARAKEQHAGVRARISDCDARGVSQGGRAVPAEPDGVDDPRQRLRWG